MFQAERHLPVGIFVVSLNFAVQVFDLVAKALGHIVIRLQKQRSKEAGDQSTHLASTDDDGCVDKTSQSDALSVGNMIKRLYQSCNLRTLFLECI